MCLIVRKNTVIFFITNTKNYWGTKEISDSFFSFQCHLFPVSNNSASPFAYLSLKCFLHLSHLCFHGDYCNLNSHDVITWYQSLLTLMYSRNILLVGPSLWQIKGNMKSQYSPGRVAQLVGASFPYTKRFEPLVEASTGGNQFHVSLSLSPTPFLSLSL